MSDKPALTIIHRDDSLVAIDKPSGLLVHKSPIDRFETRFALQMLRDQIGQRVYPVHRLDKATSGVLLFALDPDTAGQINRNWHQARKRYLAVVRGYAPAECRIDHPLKRKLDKIAEAHKNPDAEPQSALTEVRRLARVEVPYRVDKFPANRYSLVECFPHTGRKHQIRRHLKHIGHPVVGDAKHGNGRHNRFIARQYGANRLLLAAAELSLPHPVTGELLTLRAPLTGRFARLLETFGWREAFTDQPQGNYATG